MDHGSVTTFSSLRPRRPEGADDKLFESAHAHAGKYARQHQARRWPTNLLLMRGLMHLLPYVLYVVDPSVAKTNNQNNQSTGRVE